jgi:hypothetical protein
MSAQTPLAFPWKYVERFVSNTFGVECHVVLTASRPQSEGIEVIFCQSDEHKVSVEAVVVALLTASKLLQLEARVPISGESRINNACGGSEMESYHWFFLGMMVAITPSLLVLSVLLARSMDHPGDTQHSSK